MTNNRIVQFACHRLFCRDATHEELSLLHGVALKYGYSAFIALLLRSEEYERKYGNGLPGAEEAIPPALESSKS